jgi:tripartite-type tricarboxylate transporter receptor subunit TctC
MFTSSTARPRGAKRSWVALAVTGVLALGLGACSTSGTTGGGGGGGDDAGLDYPKSPVQVVVGFNAGGALDLAARQLAKDMPSDFGSNLVVVNVAGDGGVIGANQVFSAAADGYTVYFGSVAALAIQPWRADSNVPYGDTSDYTPVANVLYFPQVLSVPADAPYDTPKEFIEYAEDHPGEVRIGTGGVGTLPDIALQQMKRELDVDVTDVPFQGFAQSIPALLSGSIEGVVSSPADVAQHVDAGTLKVLGTFNEEPIESMPDVKSFTTAGMGYTQDNYYFVVAPKGVPDEVVEKLADGIKAAVESSAFTDWAKSVGATVQFQDADELGARLQGDYERYEQIVGDLGL